MKASPNHRAEFVCKGWCASFGCDEVSMIWFRKWSARLSVALMVSGCTAVFPYETVPTHVPVIVTLDEETPSSLAMEAELAVYIQAVESEDYAGALGPGTRVLDLLGEQLSAAPDPTLAPAQHLVTLALQLGELYFIEQREADIYKTFDRALDHFTAAWGANSVMHYIPLREFTAVAIQRKNVDQAEESFASLSEIVRKNFDFASAERARFFLVEADLIVLRATSSTYITRKSKKALFLQAPKAWMRAHDDYEAIDNKAGAGDALFYRGRFEMEADRTLLAQDYLQKALDLYEQGDLLPGDERVLRCHTFLARLHLRRGKPNKATPHLQHVERHQSDKEHGEPVPLFREPPKYPFFARLSGVGGWVLVEFTVTAEGKVIDPVVLDSSPVGTFEQSAKEAIVKWRYTPVLEGGVPVESKTKVQMTFKPPKKK